MIRRSLVIDGYKVFGRDGYPPLFDAGLQIWPRRQCGGFPGGRGPTVVTGFRTCHGNRFGTGPRGLFPFHFTLSLCVERTGGLAMRNSINATTANGMTGRQVRTNVRGMVQLRKAGSVAPRFYRGPVLARGKCFGNLCIGRPSCWSGAQHCRVMRLCEDLQEPRSCATKPGHARPFVIATGLDS